MLARLQRLLCLLLASLALAWLVGFWSVSPLLALAGLAWPALGYGALLAGEFALLARQHGDPAPRPTPAQLLTAWWAELRSGMQVFFWRQPFREHAEPDHLPPGTRRRGVVFVHGLFCNRGFWAPWMRRARALGLPHVAVSLEPVTGSIDAYVPAIDAAVARLMAATGQPPVLVCHSMGGLAARAWLRTPGATDCVAHVVTIASPHSGTWMAQLGHGENARQMERNSRWLARLARDEAQAQAVPFTCWYSNCDNVVFPVSTAARAGADNRFVPGHPHVALAFQELVLHDSLQLVRAA
ncbi:alpha/beta hydrolase family protein [Pseudorhodoferax soli]|uniref:Alpha/beta hydrolase family protein n=1 Tax=Pseudorhodoferax soli TaxID=545864 RepID=A0A368Y4K8_9BURK|nr:alpha/beta fold hydrolase [Pseudorhodoferax soli]RCW74258.1 alpha/beta hydrolase family protein [Pseudorhodoferax soli]